jgi:hypothetical protein
LGNEDEYTNQGVEARMKSVFELVDVAIFPQAFVLRLHRAGCSSTKDVGIEYLLNESRKDRLSTTSPHATFSTYFIPCGWSGP